MTAVKRGSYILAYSVRQWSRRCVRRLRRSKVDGKDVLVVNASHWMSEIGARLAPDCEFAVIWYWDHKERHTKVSLRAFHDTVDVSEVSKKFGGGGHKKAAGFQLPENKHIESIFDKPKTKKSRRKNNEPA